MTVPDDDRPLVERAQRGDHRAFEMLVLKYRRRVERLVGRMVRDPALAQDVVQESFIRAYRALPQFRGEAAFYTWLYRIAVNTARRILVERARDPVHTDTLSEGAPDGTQETFSVAREPSHDATPEAVMASRQVAEAVNDAIEALSDELRQAITLREIEGLSYEDIAAAMACPIGTVRSRIYRARESIAERLRPLLGPRDNGRW